MRPLVGRWMVGAGTVLAVLAALARLGRLTAASTVADALALAASLAVVAAGAWDWRRHRADTASPSQRSPRLPNRSDD
jgi:protein-S-isoprenylcysteine O-methyltransferase Ste14